MKEQRQRKLDSITDQQILDKIAEVGKVAAAAAFAVNPVTLNAEIDRRALVVPRRPHYSALRTHPPKKKSGWLKDVDDADLERNLREKSPLDAAEFYGVDIKVIHAERSRLGVSKGRGRRGALDSDGVPKLERFGVAYRRAMLTAHSDEEAAEIFDVPVTNATKERQRLGLYAPASTPTVPKPRCKDLTELTTSELKKLLTSARPWDDIAREYDVTVHRLVREGQQIGVYKRQEAVRSFADLGFRLGQGDAGSHAPGSGPVA